MSFPPSSVIRDMAMFLEMAALESAVLTLRPELAGCLRTTDSGRPLLAFDVPDHERVGAGLVRGDAPGYVTMWVIEDGRPGDHASRWPRGTRSQQLAAVVVERIDAVTTAP